MTIIEQLEEFRLENKISQQEIANRLGISINAVNRWLTGKTTPNKIQAFHIKKLIQGK